MVDARELIVRRTINTQAMIGNVPHGTTGQYMVKPEEHHLASLPHHAATASQSEVCSTTRHAADWLGSSPARFDARFASRKKLVHGHQRS